MHAYMKDAPLRVITEGINKMSIISDFSLYLFNCYELLHLHCLFLFYWVMIKDHFVYDVCLLYLEQKLALLTASTLLLVIKLALK